MARLTYIRTLLGCASLTILVGAIVAPGCSPIEKTPAPPRSARIDASRTRQVPQIMRGTVAGETTLEGFQPVPVHGLGLRA